MKSITQVPNYWANFTGKSCSPHELDQQHLSNIYWFFAIIHGEYNTWVFELLSTNFNGQLLPYQPHIKHSYEIETLGKNGNLTWMPLHDGDLIRVGQINHNGAIVGGVALPLKPGEAAEIRAQYAAEALKNKDL